MQHLPCHHWTTSAIAWVLRVGLPSFFAVAVIVSCVSPAGSARFEATQVTNAPECVANAFPVAPTFFALRDHIDSTGIFLQSVDGLVANSDTIHMEIYQPELIRDRLGEDITLDSPSGLNPVIRANILFGESCPDLSESYFIEGVVNFERLDSRVRGSLSDGAIVNARTDQRVVLGLSGEWSFEIRRGPPYELFF